MPAEAGIQSRGGNSNFKDLDSRITAQSPRGEGREGVIYWIVSQLQGGLRRLQGRLSFAGYLQYFHRLGDVFEGSAPHEIEMQMGDFLQRGLGVL